MEKLTQASATRLDFTAGLLIRRHIRRWLDRLGVIYHEDKGWLDSQFVIVADPPMMRGIRFQLTQLMEALDEN